MDTADPKSLPPFSCTYSPGLPALLRQLSCSLAISTYQAGKVILISAQSDSKLIQLPRTFDRAMGIAVQNGHMAIATKDEVIVLRNAPGLAANLPGSQGKYDALFVPRATYYTGQVDMHDLHWSDEGLWGVNTSFSSINKITHDYSWEPYWKPPFIDKLVSEDRCHLNGMALQQGEPAYATALSTGNTLQSWRTSLPAGGVLLDIKANQIIAKDLLMPHSPTIIQGELYILLSASGVLAKVDTTHGTVEEIASLNGFVRGLGSYGDYVFIGYSKLRSKSSTFKDLPIAEKATHAGVSVLHLPSRKIIADLKYHSSVEEIFDVQILENTTRPGILGTQNPFHKYGLSIPGETFWAKEAHTRGRKK